MGEVFYFSLVFSSTPLLLVEYSRSDPEGRAAILVSCPAGTISRRIRESKDKLLNMTQKNIHPNQGVSQSICVRERKKKKQIDCRFGAVPWCVCDNDVAARCKDSCFLISSDTAQTSKVIWKKLFSLKHPFASNFGDLRIYFLSRSC